MERDAGTATERINSALATLKRDMVIIFINLFINELHHEETIVINDKR